MSLLIKGVSCSLEESVDFSLDVADFVDCNLTADEIVISSLLSRGLRVKEIAVHLNISRRYATTLVSKTRKKFREFIDNYN